MEACKSARILWVVTGSGRDLRRVAMLAAKVAKLHAVTVVFTRAGYEVARMFGVLGWFRLAAPGGYYREFIVEGSYSGIPVANRVAARRYDVVVVAPASSNTVAKIVYGIADSVASTIVNQALKAGIPVVIMPSEKPGGVDTETPCYIDHMLCAGCTRCIPVCPVGAIHMVEGKARIDLSICVGCLKCVAACPERAIKCFDRVIVKPSPIDLENLERLANIKGIYITYNVEGITDVLAKLGFCVDEKMG